MSDRSKKTQAAVLSVLRGQRGAMSAYTLLDELRTTKPTISAPTIYRALAALTECGQVHRLESLNAFIACKDSDRDQGSILSICDDCGAVEESVAPDLLAELSKVAGQSGFAALRHVVEIHGQCASCNRGGAQA
ncbi:MAG: Fur family transcriptional regulator [Pseudomonadota bacterium]